MFLYIKTILFSFLLIGIQTANVDYSLKNDVTSSESRIVGGKDATNVAIPWQISLVHYGAHHCGGSILNENTIITAAHCVFGLNKRFVKIRVGSKYRSKGGKLYTVKGWKVHEKFNFSFQYDVAVIFLNENIDFVKNISEPIKLAEYHSKIPHGEKAMVSGWGMLTPHGGFPEMLQYAIVPIWSNDICEKIYAKKLHDSMICAGFWEGAIDACQQDSGGPLELNNTLVGIVSWGDGCAKPERPGVYANVSALRKWIDMALINLQ